MKNLLLILNMFILSANCFTQNIEWLKILGNDNYKSANSITLLESNVALGGFFQDTLIFGLDTLTSNGSWEGYLSILDSSGNFIKSINWGGLGINITNFVKSSGNLLIISGTTYGNYNILGNQYQPSNGHCVFIAKINNSLTNVEWIVNDYSSDNDNFNHSLSVLDTLINISGNYTGEETRTYNTDGELLWVKEYPTSTSSLSTLDSTTFT